ncbi:hypothetical protein RFI_11410 [Reticulomyxa filosa]|uniref:Uncharacterized protein n=1 Tax=Reticulomyxa filosa TaxID=46433 RepID=X6NJ03_RETFI|nr:hypothetical protein RFI_11410 [Reticulomyxa filosa]|eukprot:ETO25724.1 hypothetical protein RFI_11410 [Reticulomyxa filosa]
MLEDELKQIKNDPSFTGASLRATNTEKYTLDLSKFIVECITHTCVHIHIFGEDEEGGGRGGEEEEEKNAIDEDEKKGADDSYPIQSGLDDIETTDISPLVMEKMKQALEAAQERKVKDGLTAGSGNDNSMYLTDKEHSTKKKRCGKEKKFRSFQKKKQNLLQSIAICRHFKKKKKGPNFYCQKGF